MRNRTSTGEEKGDGGLFPVGVFASGTKVVEKAPRPLFRPAIVFLLVACWGSLPVAAAQDADAAEEISAGPISGARDLLRRYGIDDSHFEKLIDGRPIDDNETETLLNVIYRMCDFRIPGVKLRIRGFRTADVERWTRGELNLAELVREPKANRGEIFQLFGRVSSIEVRQPWPEDVERFELKQYYRCEFILADGSQPAVVYTRNVPRRWQAGGKIDQRVGAPGLFLKFAAEDAQRPVPVFVAPRVAWHPETLLGELGMDVGLLDDVQNKTKLTEDDRECFYQMLAAAGRAKPRQLLRAARQELERAGREEFSVEPLFNRPDRQRGRLVALSGTVRRVVRVRVGDPDVVARFGIDHYYNLFLFTDDSLNNPIVFCVRELPQGMPEGEGPKYREQVRVAGFFMKSWAYPIARPRQNNEGARGGRWQLAPLLIGREPVWYPYQPPPANTLAGAIAGGLFLAALLGIWIAVWRYGRGDKRFRDGTIAKALQIDSPGSLDEIARKVDGPSQEVKGLGIGD